ncbi:MAG: M28 family peptidase [Ferruginibacter sp.]
MKLILYLFFFCTCFVVAEAQPVDSIIQRKSLVNTVTDLSSDKMNGRLTGTIDAYHSADYIRTAFYNYGLKEIAGFPHYFDSFAVTMQGNPTWGINVMGVVPAVAPTDTIIIFSAHYDHLGEIANANSGEDGIYNGANDNASGVAALLELANYYQTIHTNKYNCWFVAFSGEELGLLGSEHLAATINLKKVFAVVNMDMMGIPDANYEYKCAVFCKDDVKTVKKLNHYLQETGGKKNFFVRNEYFSDLFSRSDQYSFAGKVKNCIMFSATSDQSYLYHTVKDQVETIDFDFLLNTTKNIALACRIFTE